ncbi:MAG: DnaJ domain-containing protein [Hyphomicrobiales bacterium]|nr:DnaJ domain-containing protein [Hyphomicrobiales bacterium]
MPPQVIGIAILVAVLVLLAQLLGRGNPANTGQIMRRTVGGAFILIALLLVSRGLLPTAIPFFLVGLMILGFGGMLGVNFPWGQKSPGQSSSVRTEMLSMELDHDSGELDGEILAGTFAGKRLGDLSLEQLMILRRECLAVTDQSTALLDAYLDRMHREWREVSGAAPGDGPGSSGGADDMSVDEAFSILGLERGSSAEEIHKAHRQMMKKFHPDHGGSEYLARKINQARDVLLAGSS